jgi:hypothetical protein
MNTRDIKDIIKEVKLARKDASINYEDVPYQARGAYGIKIREAQDKLPGLINELKLAIIPSKLVAVYATGSKKTITEVADFIQENGGIAINTNGLYESIADRVEATYGKDRTFGVSQFVAMMNELKAVAYELSCEVTQPDFTGAMTAICKDKDAVVAHVRGIIKEFVSDDLNRKYITKIIMDGILSGAVDSKQVAVLVTGTQSLEDKAVLAALFATTTDYNFNPSFIVSKPNIAKIFKSPSKGNDAVNVDE